MKKVLLILCAMLLFAPLAHAGGIWGGGGSGSMTYPAAAGIVLYGGSNTWGSSIVSAGTCIVGYSNGVPGCYPLLSQDDSAGQIYNAAAPTKLVKISAAAVTAGNTRVLNMADGDVTLLAGTTLVSGGALGTPASGSAANLTEVRTGAKGSPVSGLTQNKAYYTTGTPASPTWTLADNSTPAKAHCFAISATECIDHGKYVWTGHGFTSVGPLYLTTAGNLTVTEPSTSTYIIQYVGKVIDANTIIIDVSPETMTVL
jgi:hypothetical protein